MKKIIITLTLFIFFATTISVYAEGETWVGLESDTSQVSEIGQVITLSLSGSIANQINGAGIVLNYDPSCLQVKHYQAGSLLPNAIDFKQDNPGSFDITYYYQGASQAMAGEGSLIIVSFEAINICETSISTDPALITLGAINEEGISVGLTDVDYRDLTLYLGMDNASESPVDEGLLPPVNISPASEQTIVEIPIPAEESIPMPVQPASPSIENGWYPSNMTFLIIALILIAVILLLRLWDTKKQKKPTQTRPTFRREPDMPTLIAETGTEQGYMAALNRQRTLLGRHGNCQINAKNNHISRQHAEIIQRDGAYYLADVGSRNGTFLNGNRLNAGYHLLHDGDQVRLGRETAYRFAEPYGRTIQYA